MELAKFITIAFLLVSAWYLWFIARKNYALDLYREKLFNIRHDLFIRAAEKNGIEFKDDLYIKFERLFNSSIRYAHTISFFRMKIFNFVHKVKFGKDFESSEMVKFLQEIDNYDKLETRKFLQDLNKKYFKATFIYLISTSLPLILYFTVKMIVLIIRGIASMRIVKEESMEYTRRITAQVFIENQAITA